MKNNGVKVLHLHFDKLGLTREQYIENFGFPLTNLDYFIFEIVNVVYMNIKNYLLSTVLSSIIVKLSKKCKIYLYGATQSKDAMFDYPFEKSNFDFEEDFGVTVDVLPINLRIKNNITRFYLGFSNFICGELNYFLDKYFDEDNAYNISTDVYVALIYFISENCIGNCNNSCVFNSKQNAYCAFCLIYKDNKLLCPLKNEIKFEKISACNSDMYNCP